jgi:hypothetical protein
MARRTGAWARTSSNRSASAHATLVGGTEQRSQRDDGDGAVARPRGRSPRGIVLQRWGRGERPSHAGAVGWYVSISIPGLARFRREGTAAGVTLGEEKTKVNAFGGKGTPRRSRPLDGGRGPTELTGNWTGIGTEAFLFPALFGRLLNDAGAARAPISPICRRCGVWPAGGAGQDGARLADAFEQIALDLASRPRGTSRRVLSVRGCSGIEHVRYRVRVSTGAALTRRRVCQQDLVLTAVVAASHALPPGSEERTPAKHVRHAHLAASHDQAVRQAL